MVDKLIASGMDVARLNFSHGTFDTHRKVYDTLRERAKAWKKPLAILQDLQGPKIRLGLMPAGRNLTIKDGDTVILTIDPNDPRENAYPSEYKGVVEDVVVGDPILLDDGNIVLDVLSSTPRDVTCRVVQGGTLRNKVGMHLPKSHMSAPALSEKDREDLKFGLSLGVDYIALSFVKNAEDVIKLRREIGRDEPHIIAKIERPEAVRNLEEILDVADGLMVARGDLGVEMSPEKVPVVQKYMVELANQRAKPVIVATQMLESMIESMRPTRAEASDVANAIFDGADAVMLSGETANGAHPVRVVEMMASIIREVEGATRYWQSRIQRTSPEHNFVHAITKSAVAAQAELDLPLIAAHTMSGHTARLLSSYKPRARIVALTPSESAERRMNLYWGVTPVPLSDVPTVEALTTGLESALLQYGLARRGDTLVLCANMPPKEGQATNFLKLHTVSADAVVQKPTSGASEEKQQGDTSQERDMAKRAQSKDAGAKAELSDLSGNTGASKNLATNIAKTEKMLQGDVANQDTDARRKDQRRSVNLLIDYQSLDQFFNDYATNISLGGVFIRSRNPLPVGTRLRVAFSLPGLEKMVETQGEVAHVMDGRSQDGFTGMGIRFADLDPKAKRMIDKLVTTTTQIELN